MSKAKKPQSSIGQWLNGHENEQQEQKKTVQEPKGKKSKKKAKK